MTCTCNMQGCPNEKGDLCDMVAQRADPDIPTFKTLDNSKQIRRLKDLQLRLGNYVEMGILDRTLAVIVSFEINEIIEDLDPIPF